MKKFRMNIFIAIIFALLAFACSDDFAPYANSDSGYMVYCILDNRLNTQFVALQKIHLPGGDKKMPANTRVAITNNNVTNVFFRDTVISGNDNYSYYYLPNFKPIQGRVYRLTAAVDSMGSQYADLPYCGQGPINITSSKKDGSILSYGFSYSNSTADYFMFNIFIDYMKDSSGINVNRTIKVPIKINIKEQYSDSYDNSDIWRYDYNILDFFYPENSYKKKDAGYGFTYKKDVFYYSLKFLVDKNIDPEKITIKRAYLVFTAYADNSYDENKVSNFVNYSLRLDESVYKTNIYAENGYGHGLFGALSVDTTVFKLDNVIIKEFGYKDGQ